MNGRLVMSLQGAIQKMLPVFALSLLLAGVPQAGAQIDDLITITTEGTSQATSPVEASKEIQAKAIAEVVRERVRDILGEKRYQKNKSAVESKIVKQSAKFIPYINTDTPVRQEDGSWKMKIELKLSSASLHKMILEAGLLSDADSSAAILPMISFVDRQKSGSLRWWMGEPKSESTALLSRVSESFHEALQVEFSRQGFHVIKPQGRQFSPIPNAFQVERPGSREYKFLSDFYQAPMILKGDARIKEIREPIHAAVCAIKLQIVQTQTGRTVAELSRQIEADIGSVNYDSAIANKLAAELPDIAKDLASQVYEVWQRGTLNTNQIRLAIRSSLTPKQLNQFKSGLMGHVQQVKSLRERLFDSAGVQFEVDYSGETETLIDRLKALHLQGFETRVSSVSDSVVSMEVKAR